MKSRYLLFQKTESLLIEEKAQKLFGITRLLDRYLESDYEALINSSGLYYSSRESKIQVLNAHLRDYCDLVAQAFPGVGVGYYSKDLRAILTYGPSSQFGDKVGMDLGTDHLGWQAMETGKETVGIGSMVRGEIMNCMRPIVRKGKAIGFVWANEALEDIYAQIQLGAKRVFFSQDIEAILGLTGLLLFSSRILLSGQMSKEIPLGFARNTEKLRSYVGFFLDSLSLGVIVADSRHKIVFMSKGTDDILGRGRGAYEQWNVEKFLLELGLNPKVILEDAVQGAKGRFLNTTVFLGEAKKVVTIISSPIVPVLDKGEPGSKEHGHVIIMEDLESARAQEIRIERAERLSALGELAAAIAHEIRNPLTIVKGAASLIPSRLLDQEFMTKFSSVVQSELSRMNQTLDALLNFSRYSSPRMEPCHVERAMKRACDVISGYALAHRVKIQTNITENLPPIRGDEDHLVQAFLNLLLNSIQAMPDGGEIIVGISVSPGSSFAQITIKDQGIGIAPENREKIFDMFFTTKKDGTGLGLPLVQRIIYEHEGFIELESEPKRGTTFVIRLPILSNNSRDLKRQDFSDFSWR